MNGSNLSNLTARMTTYVAKKWEVNERPNANGNYVEIVGRRAGFLGWILEKIGIDPTAAVYVSNDNFIIERASFAGTTKEVVPLKKISATSYGFAKPVAALVLGILLAVPTVGIALVVGILYYAFNKTLNIGIKGSGGVNLSLNLKTKRAGEENLTQSDGAAVAFLLQQLLDETHSDGEKQKQLGGRKHQTPVNEEAPEVPIP